MPDPKKSAASKGSKRSPGKKAATVRRRSVHPRSDKVDDDGTQVEQVIKPKRKPKPRKISRTENNSVEDTPYAEKLKEFAQTVIERGPVEIANEFNRIRAETMQPPAAKTAFDANAAKNRYKDVFCTDPSRVVLKDAFAPSCGDYIHANFIRSHGDEERFICTQGPLDTTIDDFWRLVWQEKCTAIVMLCDVVEGGKQKCAQYWPPDVGKSITTQSGFTIRSDEAQDLEKTDAQTLRKTTLTLTLAAESMTVAHWHWQHWPDRGVPAAYLLALRLLVKIRNDRKVLVHCSAGIGRTGTVVGLEMADRVLKAGETLSMETVLRELRACRHGSVQTDVQYVYMHRVIVSLAVNKKLITDKDAQRFYTPYEEFMKSRGL
ncbi:Protein T27A3.5 [Aphelenchoides avenae]|nr:Protein T27A3.5 [Aphelenchus avenae]